MKYHWRELLSLLDYKEGETIVDVGGAYDPIPIADMVIDCANLGRGGKSYTILDLCSDVLPFKDKEFDICICSQTLEDLACPILAVKEMSRIAKRGIIEVPHRGSESVLCDRYNSMPKPQGAMDYIWHFGVGHHKWLIEEFEHEGVKYLYFVPKIQYMLMRHPIPRWSGPGGIRFIWHKYIPFAVLYDVDEANIERDYSRFKSNNIQYWQ